MGAEGLTHIAGHNRVTYYTCAVVAGDAHALGTGSREISELKAEGAEKFSQITYIGCWGMYLPEPGIGCQVG